MNDHHYFQDHHTNARTSSQDHTNSIDRHKDTSSQDHTSSINSHTDTVHSQYTTYIFPYHTTPHEDRRNTGFYKDISYKTFIHIRTIYNELLSDIYTVNSSIFHVITNNFHRFGHYKTITTAFNHIIYFNIFNTIFASNITQRL